MYTKYSITVTRVNVIYYFPPLRCSHCLCVYLFGSSLCWTCEHLTHSFMLSLDNVGFLFVLLTASHMAGMVVGAPLTQRNGRSICICMGGGGGVNTVHSAPCASDCEQEWTACMSIPKVHLPVTTTTTTHPLCTGVDSMCEHGPATLLYKVITLKWPKRPEGN